MMPTTFTRRTPSGGRIEVATITSQEYGRRLPYEVKSHCAYILAVNCIDHRIAVEQCIALGLADDEADADQLIRDGEEYQL